MFTFADLFAGIGGFRIAAEELGGKCIFTSEVKKSALRVYSENFEPTEPVDISTFPLEGCQTPDLVFAGWPCQSFSQAGHKLGFHDATRGTLFFHLANYLEKIQPPYILLENVRNLVGHDNGRTFEIVSNSLLDLGYTIDHRVLFAKDYGLPQIRSRVYIVGYKGNEEFSWPKASRLTINMSNVLKGNCEREIGFTLREGGFRSPINDRHNWDGYWVDGEERRLTWAEAKIMQGFPLDFKLPTGMADSTGVKLLGNAVPVNVVRAVTRQLLMLRERQIGKKERTSGRNKTSPKARQKTEHNR